MSGSEPDPTTRPSRGAPALALRGTVPNLRPIYAYLREEWVRRAEGRTYTALARSLSVRKQVVTNWATGSGGASPPPSWVLMWLCHDLNYVLVFAPEGVYLARAPAETST